MQNWQKRLVLEAIEVMRVLPILIILLYEVKFLFSYLSNGMDIIDVLHLKRSAVESDRFHFIRDKIKSTTKTNQKKIEVALHPETKRIIQQIPKAYSEGCSNGQRSYHIFCPTFFCKYHVKFRGIKRIFTRKFRALKHQNNSRIH